MTKIKILLAEDEVVLGTIIKDTLEVSGFETTHISDGAHALRTYFEMKPDVIILDIMLPSVSGLEIASAIRLEDQFTPILFLTARSTTDDLIKGFSAGGNDYIKKPFDLKELLVRIEALVARNQLLEPKDLPVSKDVKIGQYFYDTTHYTLLINATIIKLSARESEVLTILYQYRSQLLTRKTLLMHVWGNDDFFSSRSLDVYISKLRRHFRSDPSVQIINHRGFGYKLIC